MASSADLKIKVTTDVSSATGGLTKLLFSFNQITQAAGFVAGRFEDLKRAAKECIDLYGVQQRAEIQLATSIKATGNAIGVSLTQLKEMASGFQSVTTYGDETVLSMESIFVSSRAIARDSLPRVTEAALDMATAMGTDAVGAAKNLSKILADPARGMDTLRQANVHLSDSVREQIVQLQEQGDLYGAQQIILDHIESAYGGISRAVAETDLGKLQQAGNAWGDIKENIGDLILMYSSGAINFFSKATQDLANNVAKFIQKEHDQLNTVKGQYSDVSTEWLEDEIAELAQRIQNQQKSLEEDRAHGYGNAKEFAKRQKEINQLLQERKAIMEELWRREHAEAEESSSGTEIPGYPTGGKDPEDPGKGVSAGASSTVKAVETLNDYIAKNRSLSRSAQVEYINMQIAAAQAHLENAEAGSTEERQLEQIIHSLRTQKANLLAVEEEEKELYKARASQGMTIDDFIDSNRAKSKEAQAAYLDMQIAEAKMFASNLTAQDEEYNQIYEIINALEDEKKALYEVNNEMKEYRSFTFNDGVKATSDFVSAVGNLYSTLAGNVKGELQEMKDAWSDYYDDLKAKHEKDRDILDAQLASGIIGYEEYQEAVTNMYEKEVEAKQKEQAEEEKLKQKADELAKKAFYANQLNSFANATISGAQAIMRAWADYPYYVAAPLTALLASTTAIQQATIMSQKYTGAATGGIVQGPTHILAGEGEGPEAVLPLSKSRLKEYGLLNTDDQSRGVIYLTINVTGADSTPEAVFQGIERAQRQGILPKWRYA